MQIRNIAIIAHVDHGKTTLVDALLKQSERFKLKADAPQELLMDSNELERERGITIFSKNASLVYHGVKVNVVDTPGHADFGGEVERIMRMVDGVLLLVDAKEGPMPQTTFVLRKAIQAGHPVIVVINKVDKPDARPLWALNQTFDLFVELGASERQANFPVVYAIAKEGRAGLTPDLGEVKDIQPLFEAILAHVSPPVADPAAPLQMLTVNLAYDTYKGKLAIGRLYQGKLKKGMRVAHVNREGKISPTEVTSVMLFEGMQRVDVAEAEAGDIAAIAGIAGVSIGETITDLEHPTPLPTIAIDEPTVKMTFAVNSSPFTGKEGTYSMARNLAERLAHELETDVALTVTPTESPDAWVVSGRGELHLAILIEKMRREGYELEVGKPQVIMKDSPDGKGGLPLEPFELVSLEVPEEFSGVAIEMLGKRLGTMRDMRVDRGRAHMDFTVPTRGLIGIRNEFLTSTKGQGIMHSLFLGYERYKGSLTVNHHGSLVASESGTSNSYGLLNIQDRGQLFIGPGVEVYEGMVIGQHSKPHDIVVNVCKAKELTNFRSKNMGIQEVLEVPRTMGLEDALDYIGDDELVEVTPQSIRIRKRHLSEHERKRSERGAKESE